MLPSKRISYLSFKIWLFGPHSACCFAFALCLALPRLASPCFALLCSALLGLALPYFALLSLPAPEPLISEPFFVLRVILLPSLGSRGVPGLGFPKIWDPFLAPVGCRGGSRYVEGGWGFHASFFLLVFCNLMSFYLSVHVSVFFIFANVGTCVSEVFKF